MGNNFTVGKKKRSVGNGRRNRDMASAYPTDAVLFQAEKPQTEKRGLRYLLHDYVVEALRARHYWMPSNCRR